MVDSLKNLTSLPNSGSPAGDSLRKNLKSISSVSVSRGTEAAVDSQQNSPAEQAATTAVVRLTDAIQLSADALRSLGNASQGADTAAANPDVVQENISAASVSPEDLQKVQEQADNTGAAIGFNRDEALKAHGKGLSAETVYRLLSD
ncbi:MAG: hypothetical protein U0136_16205 [Bdellovibrionota bacterium]